MAGVLYETATNRLQSWSPVVGIGRRRLGDDHHAAAETARVHPLLGLGRSFERVLADHSQLDVPVACELAKIFEPVGVLQHLGHPHGMDLNPPCGLASIPPTHHHHHSSSVLDRVEHIAAKERCVI